MFSEAEKAEARETLTALIGDDDDDRSAAEDELGAVLYRAPDPE